MKRLRHLFVALGALAILSLVGCTAPARPPTISGGPPPTPMAGTALPDRRGMTPEEVVSAFYTWYIDYYPGNPRVDGSLAAGGYLTEEHLQRIDEMYAGFVGGGADPLLCAQDVPTSVSVHPSVITGEHAALLMDTSVAGQTLEVHLHLVDGLWQIDRVYCAPSELSPEPTPSPEPVTAPVAAAHLDWPAYAALSANWDEYRNDAYGLSFRYPPDWVYRELASSPDAPPIGPENIRLLIHLMPLAWAATTPDPASPGVTPFLVEVSEGTLEQYRWSNMEPARVMRLDVRGRPVTWEEEAVTDTLSLQRLVFEHPENADLRVTLHDPISGFPERFAAHASAVELFHGVVASSEYTD